VRTNRYWNVSGHLVTYIWVSYSEAQRSAEADWGRSTIEGGGATIATPRYYVEWPTLAVAAAVYLGYGILTWFYQAIPIWLWVPLSAVWLAWYGSLQHETIHDHPTRSRRINARIASLPLSLWIPYRIYRLTHLQHHRYRGGRLTDVADDPESFYVAPGTLARHRFARSLYVANCTLVGRLILGPAVSVYRFWASEVRVSLAGDTRRPIIWGYHLLAVAAVLVWTTVICHIPVAVYVLLVVYPSISLTHLRSFAEHRADPVATRRTVSVESSGLWALIFLNNNLHIAHHAYAKVPWYRLPSIWLRMRAHAVEQGLVFAGGYRQVAREYWLRPVITVEHPEVMDRNAVLAPMEA
jgi:fatty acid desaturase